MKAFVQELKDKIHEIEKKMLPEVKHLEQEAHDVFVNKVEPILKEKLEAFEKYLIPIVEKMIEDKMKSLVK
jgi:hypothetical protein